MEAPDGNAWKAWTPWEAAPRLAAANAPWMVVGGWALDLWHGRETRSHEDLEIAVPRPRFDTFRTALAGHELFTAGDGKLTHLPPGAPASTEHHQNWVLDPSACVWRMDLMLEPGDDATWVCRRDETGIRLPRAGVVALSKDGIPYLRPEFVLLFKAKGARPKDEADLELALPHLDPAARAWLRDALARLRPGHAWLKAL